jgi:hypothetical protein
MKRLYLPAVMLLFVTIFMGFSRTEAKGSSHMEYFSSSYQVAREKFIKAAQEAGASIDSFQNPHMGPLGEPLFTDVAIIGSKHATDYLVLGSGTHGVEGFAGSGIQTGLLRKGIHNDLGPHMGLIMIHAINPYGFAHLRRSNEDNIDLNRNFIDHTKPYPENEGYEELADVILPKSLSVWENLQLRISLLWYRLKHGRDAMKRAVSGDQFSHPQGLFFGGHHEAWSNKTLKEIARRYLSDAKRVVFIDVHTGLGPFGGAEIIMNSVTDSPEYQRAVQMWGDLVRTTVSGNSVSVHLHASLKLAIPRMIPQIEVTAVSLEFGTYPIKEVFLALRAENWLHHYGGVGHPRAQEIKTELLRVFYPNTDDWNQSIWYHGKEIVNQALKNFQ